MAANKASYTLSLIDNFTDKASKVAGSLGGLKKSSNEADTAFSKLSKSMDKSADIILNKWSGLAGVVGAGTLTRSFMSTQNVLTDLQISAGVSAGEINNLQKAIFNAGIKSGISTSKITAGLQNIVSKTGDFAFAKNSIADLTLAMSAFGSTAEDTSSVMATLFTSGVKEGSEMLNVLAKIGSTAKAGSVEVKDMASQFSKALGIYGGFGSSNLDRGAMAGEIASLYQTTNLTTSNAAESTTAISSLVKSLAVNYEKINKGLGVNVMDEGGGLRSISKIIPEIIKASKGDLAKLTSVGINETAATALTQLIKEFRDLGDLRFEQENSFAKILGSMADEQSLINDARIRQQTLANSWTKITVAFEAIAYEFSSSILEPLSNLLSGFSPETTKALTKTVVYLGTTLVGLAALIKTIKVASTVLASGKSLFGGFKKAANGAMTVFVTNPSARSVGGDFGGKGSKMAKLAGKATGAAGGLIGTVGLYDAVSSVNDDESALGKTMSYSSAALSGAGLGAAIGSVVPVLGTAVGAAVGAGIGLLATGLADYFGSSEEEKARDKAPKIELVKQKPQELNVVVDIKNDKLIINDKPMPLKNAEYRLGNVVTGGF